MRTRMERKISGFRQREVLLTCALVMGGLSCSDGPDAECRSYLDCNSNQTCDTETGNCVSISSGPYGDGISTVPGAGTTPTPPGETPPLRTTYQTTGPVSYISHSPAPALSDAILFSEPIRDDVNAPEKLRELDARAQNTVQMPVYLDLEELQVNPCEVSALHKLTLSEPTETWVSCRQANATYLIYEGRELQGLQTLNHRSDFFLLLPTSTNGDYNRVIAGARGSSALRAYQLRTGAGDGPDVGHPFEDELPLAGGAIHGVWSATSEYNSVNSLVIFSRGGAASNPSIQFWERFSLVESWSEVVYPEAFVLPAETYLIHFTTAPHISLTDLGSNEATMLSIEPQNGLIRFWNFNGQREIFPSLQYETDARFLFSLDDIPGADVIALAESADGQYIYLAHPAGPRIWRLPTEPGREDDVRWWDAEALTLEVSSFASVTDMELWVGYRNENRLDQVTFMP